MLPNFNLYLLLIQKSFFVLGAIMYFIFSLVVVKQTSMMSRNVKDKFNSVLITFSYIHLAFSIFLVFLTLVML
jgi:hypothetical protein